MRTGRQQIECHCEDQINHQHEHTDRFIVLLNEHVVNRVVLNRSPVFGRRAAIVREPPIDLRMSDDALNQLIVKRAFD